MHPACTASKAKMQAMDSLQQFGGRRLPCSKMHANVPGDLAMPQMWDSEQICPRNGLLSQGGW